MQLCRGSSYLLEAISFVQVITLGSINAVSVDWSLQEKGSYFILKRSLVT